MASTIQKIGAALKQSNLAGPLLGAPILGYLQTEQFNFLQGLAGSGVAMALGQANYIIVYRGLTGDLPEIAEGSSTQEIAKVVAMRSIGSAVAAQGFQMLIFGGSFDVRSLGVMAAAFAGGELAAYYLTQIQ